MSLAHLLAHLVCLTLIPPLCLGIVVKVKAKFAGRRGAPLLQVYFDIIKLLQKSVVQSHTTTALFLAGPVVGLVTTVICGLLVPFGHVEAPIAFVGDLVLFAYLFALGRFFTVLAALDTGSSFEGMGAAREVTFACLAEPALFLGLLVLAKRASSLSLSSMLGGVLPPSWSEIPAPVVLVAVALFIVLLAENSRIPVDDPTTHLELTMIHEVMVLDHSGPALGMVLANSAIKLFVLGAVVVRTVIPLELLPMWASWPVFFAAMVALSVAIGIVESVMARLRLRRVAYLLVAACLLALFGLLLMWR